MDKTVSSYTIRGGVSVLALNSTDNRLIAAGQQSKNEFFVLYNFFCMTKNRFSIIFN